MVNTGTVDLADGGTGDTLTVFSAARVHGTFDSVSVAGFKATPVYGSDSVQVRLDAVQ